jgi:iron-sulfur cluster insertion protein
MEHTSETVNATASGSVGIVIEDSAVARIIALREKQGNPNLMLRVTVLGGGCSGFKYQLDFDDKTAADDVTFRGVVVTDESSLPFLQNALIYFEQNLMGSAFKIKNPNAASSCGCGKSFSTKT